MSRIAVLAELAGPAGALAELDALAAADPALRQHQPWWAVRAFLRQRALDSLPPLDVPEA